MNENLAVQPCPDAADKKCILLFVAGMSIAEEERRKAEIVAQGGVPFVVYQKCNSDDLVRVRNGLGYIDALGVYRPHEFE